VAKVKLCSSPEIFLELLFRDLLKKKSIEQKYDRKGTDVFRKILISRLIDLYKNIYCGKNLKKIKIKVFLIFLK
jgi:hypothetical protein